MLEAKNVCDTAFAKWPVSEAYDWAEGSYKAAADDRAIAIIRRFLSSDIANIRLSAQNANTAVSMVQTFVDAAAFIVDTLMSIEKLAEKAANGYYTDTDKASMQKRLEELAKAINNMVDGTRYEGNKLFTPEGRVITRSVGKNRSIHLFAKDLRFNAENVDLTKDAKAALVAIRKAVKEASEHSNYIKSQQKLLHDEMVAIDNEMASAAGFESSDFETKIAKQITNYIAAKLSEEPNVSSQSQFNITPDEALYLLRDK